MPYKDGVLYVDDSVTPNIGVSVADVQRALGEYSTGDVGRLCRSAKINKWARLKPVRVGGVYRQLVKASADGSNVTTDERAVANNGFVNLQGSTEYKEGDMLMYNDQLVAVANEYIGFETDAPHKPYFKTGKSQPGWEYGQPRGGDGGLREFCRLTDFVADDAELSRHPAFSKNGLVVWPFGYDHTAERPWMAARELSASVIAENSADNPINVKLTSEVVRKGTKDTGWMQSFTLDITNMHRNEGTLTVTLKSGQTREIARAKLRLDVTDFLNLEFLGDGREAMKLSEMYFGCLYIKSGLMVAATTEEPLGSGALSKAVTVRKFVTNTIGGSGNETAATIDKATDSKLDGEAVLMFFFSPKRWVYPESMQSAFYPSTDDSTREQYLLIDQPFYFVYASTDAAAYETGALLFRWALVNSETGEYGGTSVGGYYVKGIMNQNVAITEPSTGLASYTSLKAYLRMDISDDDIKNIGNLTCGYVANVNNLATVLMRFTFGKDENEELTVSGDGQTLTESYKLGNASQVGHVTLSNHHPLTNAQGAYFTAYNRTGQWMCTVQVNVGTASGGEAVTAAFEPVPRFALPTHACEIRSKDVEEA